MGEQEVLVGRSAARSFDVPPSAARLTSSLRDIGYDFSTAVADLVDNSVAAGATQVDIDITFDGPASSVSIADDGCGMTANGLLEALRFGTRREYGLSDLGRYGLGLKTAPLSQCRSVTVVTRRSVVNRVITKRTLDLDLIKEWDSWLIVEADPTPASARAVERLQDAQGTVVIWEKLDRVLPDRNPDGGWARRRLASYADRLTNHLGMVFHRFIEGTVAERLPLTITVNGEKVAPWNPFAPDEPATVELPTQSFEISSGDSFGEVRLRPFVLPPRDRFSSLGEFERLSGPLKWNRQQGLYAYRANRLVQWGGWNGLRAIDEHTKLARAALEFDTDLDEAFHINVAKMRASIPAELKQMLERPIHELCIRAGDAYRKSPKHELRSEASSPSDDGSNPRPVRSSSVVGAAGLALTAAAMELGHTKALREILNLVKERDADLARSLGFN